MNRTNIDWCQYTANPITGCLHDCPYCYARNIAKRFSKKFPKPSGIGHENYVASPEMGAFPYGFAPTFYPHRLTEFGELRKPAHIFVGSMTDMFGKWVPNEWRLSVFREMAQTAYHTYTMLTKGTQTAVNWLMLNPNVSAALDYLGTSITGCLDQPEIDRIYYLSQLKWIEKSLRPKAILSLEPYVVKVHPIQLDRVDDIACELKWLIIGGRTGRSPFQPPKGWIEPLVNWAHDYGIPVYVKSNAEYDGAPKEFPEGMPHDKEATR